jgi:histidinol dehydrogenase
MIETKLRPKKLKEIDAGERRKIIKRCEAKWNEVIDAIIPIMQDVKNRGDSALIDYTKKFDKADLTAKGLEVTKKEIKEAYNSINKKQYDMLSQMKRNVSNFHSCNIPKTWTKKFYSGKTELGKRIAPVDKAGAYIPGGKYNYPSTAIMAIVPAKIAGVKDIIAVTPPKSNGKIESITLVAMDMAGATRIFKIGGSQAIAALAYGTESIPGVDIIVGPGNIYVNSAKKWLTMTEGIRIDLPAGPSEILIIADNEADPDCITCDLISQAEHDENSCAILVTNSDKVADKTYKRLLKELCTGKFSNKSMSVAKKSFENFGAILLTDTLDEAVEFANDFAPEHLEIMIKNKSSINKALKQIKHAGSIFIGEYSTVAMADYNLGTNHILPTGGTAKRYSALSTETFQKISMLQKVKEDAIKLLTPGIRTISRAEGLYSMHGLSVEIRLKKIKKLENLKKKKKKL